jgi:hypothetical protein
MPSVTEPPKDATSSQDILQHDLSGEIPYFAFQHCSAVPWLPRPVAAIEACPDGTAVAVARDDGSIEIWDPRLWIVLVVRKLFRSGSSAA